MGQSNSTKVWATVTLPPDAPRLHKVSFKYEKVTCWGIRKKTIAVFAFPSNAWRTLPEGASTNKTVKATAVHLDHLRREAPYCSIATAKGKVGKKTVFAVPLYLGELLSAMTLSRTQGRICTLNLDVVRISQLKEISAGGTTTSAETGASSSSSTKEYALRCNGWLWCGDSDADVMRLMDQPPSVATEESPPLPHNNTRTTERKEKIPVSLPPGRYEVRIIIHSVHGASTFGELFPDVYVKARMMNSGTDWCRTDVHKNSVGGVALFEYRLVLPLFQHPVRTRTRRLDPILHLVVMDEDTSTSDDKIGSIRLNLEDLPAPDELKSCSLASLNNETVNLFDPSAIKMIWSESATFQRELTGYWPATRKKTFNRELKATCSVLMTIQLLNAREAAKYPADSGNKEGPGNRFPRLVRPKREHGKILSKLLYAQVEMVEAIIEGVTGVPSIGLFVVVVALIVAFWFTVTLEPLAQFAKQNTKATMGIAFSCGLLLNLWMHFWHFFTDL
uniref:C2 domain-containing protein n=1 Tax=Scylla olivacea TaxID=85551 RepID=A0A0P4WG18_SCYOL